MLGFFELVASGQGASQIEVEHAFLARPHGTLLYGRRLGYAQVACPFVPFVDDLVEVPVVVDVRTVQMLGEHLALKPGAQVDLLMKGAIPLARGLAKEAEGPVRHSHARAVATEVGDLDEEGVDPLELGQRPPELLGVGAYKSLVCVYPQDPFAPAVLEAGVAGASEVVVPVALDDPGTGLPGQFHGGVGGAGVVHDDLVDQAVQTGQAVGQRFLFVLYDEASRQQDLTGDGPGRCRLSGPVPARGASFSPVAHQATPAGTSSAVPRADAKYAFSSRAFMRAKPCAPRARRALASATSSAQQEARSP